MCYLSHSLYALLIAASIGVQAQARDVPPSLPSVVALSVRVTLSRGMSVDKLVLQITNTSGHAITVRQNTLPWSHRGALCVVVTEPTTQTELHQDAVISDMGVSLTTIPAGGTLKGSVNLNERFPQLTALSKKAALVVFWAFRLEYSNGASELKAGAEIMTPNDSK